MRWQLGPVLFFVVLGILIAIVFIVVDAVSGEVGPPASPTAREQELQAQRDRARRYADRLERIVQREVSRAERNERHVRRTRQAARKALGTSPLGDHYLEDAFECVHHFEGGWNAATGNGYWGGLQFDLDFQRAYGREFLSHWGTANHWPKSVQIAVAIRGWLRRGFQPWPNTARKCGLR
jgi:Transglycosylase-like domain